MTSPKAADEELARALARSALEERKSIKAHIYVASNNVLLALLFGICDRSGLDIPPKWVLDNGTVIRIRAVENGYNITMLHPVPVSIPARFVSKEAFDAAFASFDHKHLGLPENAIVYLVRHGHAGHNDPDASLQQARDADLTPLGRNQAVASGTAILADSQALGVESFRVFCSPLVRTGQTVYDILQQFPAAMRPKECPVLIEALEHTRPIGGVHHWRREDPLLPVAKNPFLTPVELIPLFPEGTTHEVIERARVENLPRTDPEVESEGNLMSLAELKLDWSDYVAKVSRARQEGKTFGDAASETLFLDVVLRNAKTQ